MAVAELSARTMRRALPLLLVVIASLGVAACGDDASQDAGTSDRGNTAGQVSAGHSGSSPVADDARHVPVSARSLAFEPTEISAKVDEDIAIVLTSEDSLHDVTIDELDAHVSAEEGDTAVGGFRARQPGRYTFYCSVAGHRDAGMEGIVVVEA